MIVAEPYDFPENQDAVSRWFRRSRNEDAVRRTALTKHRVMPSAVLNRGHIVELRDWFETNIQGEWTVNYTHGGEFSPFYFERKRDAVIFKLFHG
jgi:hypothetical protein